jgi:ferrous iron transport protein A
LLFKSVLIHDLQAFSMTGAPEIGLHELPQRRLASVVRLLPAGDAEEGDVLLRLLEIGFLPGEPVRVMARGFPGNDPLAVRVGHSTFALRRHEAALIRVSLTEGGPA